MIRKLDMSDAENAYAFSHDSQSTGEKGVEAYSRTWHFASIVGEFFDL